MSSSLHEIYIKLKDEATKGIKGIQNSIDGMVGAVEKNREGIEAIGVASGVAFAGLGMGIKSAVSTFADFEATMSGVKAVLKPTEEEFKKLTEQAEILGATTKFSALETAQGTEMLARNGLNAQQILGGALEATLNLAAATGTDIATAADIATDAMASFGLQTENLGQVMNSITGVTNASKFAIEDYKYALAAGGGVAAALGVELEDFNTVIAATGSRFAGGSDAGTSFKTFMQRLVPASNEAMGAMKDLGLVTFDNKKAFDQLRDLGIKPASDSFDDISKAVNSYAKKMKMTEKQVQKFWQELGNQNEFYTAEGNLKSMAEISELLKEATKDLSEEQKNQALSTIFGSDALRTAMGLAEVGAEKFTELQKSIEGTDASENAKTRMDNLKGTFEELGGAVDSVKIALGRSLAPAIKQVTIFFQDIAQKIGVWVAQNPELASTIMMVATAVTGLVAGFAGFSLVLGPIISGISLLGTIIGSLISPIGLVIGAIVALGVAYKENFLGFQDFVNGIIEWIQKIPEKWNEIKEKVVAIVTEKISLIRQKFEEGKQILSDFWAKWGNTIQVIVGVITGLYLPTLVKMGFSLVKLGITSAIQLAKMGIQWTIMGIQAVASAIKITVTAIPSIIASLIKMGLAGVVNTGKVVAGWVLMGTQSLIQAARMAAAWVIAMGPIAWVSAIIVGLGVLIWQNWDSIKKWTMEAWDTISNTISTAWDTIVSWASEKLTAFSAFLSGIWEGIKTGVTDFVDIIIQFFVGLWENITITAESVWNGIIAFLSGIWENIKTGVASFGEAVKNIWNGFWNGVKSIGENILSSIVGFVGNTWESIKSGVTGFGENIKTTWSNIWTGVKEVGGNLLSSISNGIKDTFLGVTNWIGGIFGIDLVGSFTNAFEKAKEATIGIVTGMVEKIKGILDGIKNFIGGIVSKITGAGEEANRVQASVRSGGGGGGGTSPRASGGPVLAGSRYMVGERGPELFVPSTNGYIVPNNQLGSGATIHINMGSVIVQNEADENRLAEKISQRLAKEARLYKLGIA